jgi:hypothetical protein
MVSLVSGEASAQGHLHLDPSLQIPVNSEFRDCCPKSNVIMKLLCCGGCCKSNCCNKSEVHIDEYAIYCHSDGRCEIFDAEKVENEDEALRLSAARVKALVEKQNRLSHIKRESGIDLDAKIEKAEAITVRELRRLQTM